MMSCARLTSSSWADILSKCGTENKGIPRGFSRHFPLRKNPLPLFRFRTIRARRNFDQWRQRISQRICLCLSQNLFASVSF